MPLELREFLSADIDSAIELRSGCDGIELDSSDTPDALASFLERNRAFSTVATLDGVFAGAALCGHDSRRGLLHHLAVAGFARQLGIGRAIVDRCLERLGRARIIECHALVFRDNRFGELFWSPTGWSHRERVSLYSRFS